MATSYAEFGNLHAMSDLCILVIVDRDNNPVAPGQYGEKILLTNLLNYTQPIIRYEIEDVSGYANQSCRCGLSFPTLLPIQGRTTDFMYFRKPQGGMKDSTLTDSGCLCFMCMICGSIRSFRRNGMN